MTVTDIYAYGNSYAVLSGVNFAPGGNYLQLAANQFGGAALTSYGVSGSRAIDVWAHIASEGTWPGSGKNAVPGAQWPGTAARTGLVVMELPVNDTAHYASGVTPSPITLLNTEYVDSMKNVRRAVLALMSSESRVEESDFTGFSGAWAPAGGPYSGDLVYYTTTPGAYLEFTVTPPQSGPLAGTVFLVVLTQTATSGTLAQVAVSVDGGAPENTTPPPWEQYDDAATVITGVACIPTTIPVDGAAHTVRVAHAGAGGDLLWVDVIPIPSENPNPIAVMGGETMPVPSVTGWDAAQVAIYTDNWSILGPHIQAVVAEFPNAVYVPSTATSAGLWTDGIHLNDLGMAQRAADLVNAIEGDVYPAPVIYPPGDPLCVPVSNLGLGNNTVEIQTQGGGRSLGSLPASVLDWDRVLDDMSECNVTIPVSSLSDECCGLLADTHTWGHELVVYRDGARVWEGPIVNIEENGDGVKLRAFDVLGFMLRRIHRGRVNAGPVFAVDEAVQDVTDAFNVAGWIDPDPNVLAYLTVLGAGTGPTTQRDVPLLSTYFFDTLDQLGDAGVNFTVVGRRIVIWPDTMTLGRVPALLPTQHLSTDVTIVEDGLALANLVVVTSDDGIFGVSNSPGFPASDPFYGPMETLMNIPNLVDYAACQSAADSIHAQGYPAPVRVVIPDGSTLTSDAPYSIGDLVPGVLMPVSHFGRCRTVQSDFVLTSVKVTQTDAGETVQISVAPVSASVEGSA